MIKNRALLLRVSRILVAATGVKVVRTTFDDSAIILHVVNTLRTKKLDVMPVGPVSQKVKDQLFKDFQKELEICEVHESRVNVYIPHALIWSPTGRFISGSLILKGVDESTVVFSLDPQSGICAVREIMPTDNDLKVNRVF